MSELKTKAYWNGEWHNGRGGTFPVFNPANGEKIADVANCIIKDYEEAVSSASKAFRSWSRTTVKERASLLHKLKDLLLQNKEEIATLLTMENGKSKSESLVKLGSLLPSSSGLPRNRNVSTEKQFQVHSIKKICHHQTTCWSGCLNYSQVGSFLANSENIQILSFTGSVEAGKKLYSLSANTVKKISLELGGNAPFIVFPSADLKLAVNGAMAAKFRNSGQTCVSGNRFFVHDSIHDEFVKSFSEAIDSQLKLGNGLEEGVSQGPLINNRQLERLRKIVDETVIMGAKVFKGGKAKTGLFFEPTILTKVTVGMPAAREEIFGPVAAIIRFKTEEEVIKWANDTDRGLAGYVYTNDYSQSWRMAEALEYGMVGVNESLVSTCETPFGGIKTSGFGKEGSKHGLDEYSILKYVCFGGLD
ncbi:Succinate-semialdehyde dehydrogenase, mitochondrial [Armadillidium vulgare]|nr:Succinate-semialdehyde dehydrogenase, mitochondrial [Armadillidium vulgare]